MSVQNDSMHDLLVLIEGESESHVDTVRLRLRICPEGNRLRMD